MDRERESEDNLMAFARKSKSVIVPGIPIHAIQKLLPTPTTEPNPSKYV